MITNIEAIMCAMLVQNTAHNMTVQKNRKEKEKAKKVQATSQSTFNKEKQKE